MTDTRTEAHRERRNKREAHTQRGRRNKERCTKWEREAQHIERHELYRCTIIENHTREGHKQRERHKQDNKTHTQEAHTNKTQTHKQKHTLP